MTEMKQKLLEVREVVTTHVSTHFEEHEKGLAEHFDDKIEEIVNEIVENVLESASVSLGDDDAIDATDAIEEVAHEAVEEIEVDAILVENEDAEADLSAQDQLASAEEEEVIHKQEINISMPSDLVEKVTVAEPSLDKLLEVEEELVESKVSAKPLVRKPTNRTGAGGPAVPISQIQKAVFRTNPLLDEILFTIDSCTKNDPALTKIEIVDYLLTQKQVIALSEAISTNTFLKSLVLNGCGIQTAAGSLLAKSLAVNSSIEKVSLERNALGPQAMKDFAKMIGKNTSIRELRMGTQTSITPMGLEAEQFFAEGIQKNKSIVKLSLVCKSAHCRNQVERSVTRNKEAARKLNKQNSK